MSDPRRGFFREALAGLKKLVDDAVEEPVARAPRPTFVPPAHVEGAVEPRAEREVAAKKAYVSLRLCLNSGRSGDEDDAPCERCLSWCPEGALALAANEMPVVDVGKCTGCGACTEHCAAYPPAIVMR